MFFNFGKDMTETDNKGNIALIEGKLEPEKLDLVAETRTTKSKTLYCILCFCLAKKKHKKSGKKMFCLLKGKQKELNLLTTIES